MSLNSIGSWQLNTHGKAFGPSDLVTGESFLDIRKAADEPIISVLMPTSPMPATGFTISVRKSETIDLDITIDQAIQFCVSCGVCYSGSPTG